MLTETRTLKNGVNKIMKGGEGLSSVGHLVMPMSSSMNLNIDLMGVYELCDKSQQACIGTEINIPEYQGS